MRSALALACCVATLVSVSVPLDVGAQQVAARLTVVVRGLRSDEGVVRGGLYRDRERWTNEEGVVARCTARSVRRVARCVFEGLAPGGYGLALYHDEDGDGVFGRDGIGLPQEGYAFGRDARPVLGAPSFESALVDIGGPRTEAAVTMRYGI